MSTSRISEILRKQDSALLDDWAREQKLTKSGGNRLSDSDLRSQSRQFLELLQEATTKGDPSDIDTDSFRDLRRFLEEISASRAALGFSPTETAIFVFSFKQPLFKQIRLLVGDPKEQIEENWIATLLVDKLGLFTMEMYQRSRESVILR